MFFSTYLIIGAFSGLLAGLLGLGGGTIVVPALAAAFVNYHVVPEAYIMQMAIGTSLTTIIFTFLSSLRAHIKRRSVQWPLVKKLVPGLIIGALAGSFIAKYIPSYWLSIFFSVFLLFIAFKLFKNKPSGSKQLHLPLPVIILTSLIIGILSSLLGVGGGVILIPFLLRMHINMREATGTSVACGVFTMLIASACFMYFGLQTMPPVPWSTGFVYWPAFIGIVVASVLFAPIGTTLAYKIEPKTLKRLLAVFLVFVAIDMLLPAKLF